jgi:hypothetical protein
MKMNRAYAVMLMAPVMATGLALGTPRPAQANDTGAFIAGAVLGVLLDNVFDRDYPTGFSFGYSSGYGYGDRGWYSWPQAGVFALPEYARPYPYGHRWWEFAGTFKGRPVFAPAVDEAFGYREFVPFPSRPIFLQPQVVSTWYGPTYNWGQYSRFGDRWGVFGQYGWTPAPKLRTYRVPSDRRWYDGPDPGFRGDDRKPSLSSRPRPGDMQPPRDHTWPQSAGGGGKGSPGPTWQDRPEPGWKGAPGQHSQVGPGQTSQDRSGPAWTPQPAQRSAEGRPPMSLKAGWNGDQGGKRPESLKPATPVKAKGGSLKPATPVKAKGESLKPATAPNAKKAHVVPQPGRSEKDRGKG